MRPSLSVPASWEFWNVGDVSVSRTSKEWDREQLEQIVLQHIRKHGFITRTIYTEITGRLKNSALADLKSFAAEGIIKRVGRGNQMHFIVPPVDDL